MTAPRLAISAIAGSFTEEAARHYLKESRTAAEFVYVGTARGMFEAVAKAKVELGIVPIRNSNAGFVLENMQASADFTYKIVHVFSIPIHQNLMVKLGTRKADITEIVSQLPALAQCSTYLKRHWSHVPHREYTDTALAARDLASGRLPATAAVIAARTAAELYHLEILAAGIQTDRDNYTDFMIIGPHD
jgi:prephenate dehydratase